MKIVFSTDQTYLHGGTEKVLADKANYMVEKLGYEVFIITTEQNNKQACYYLDKRIHQINLGINYHRNLSYLNPKNILKVFNHFSKLKNIIKEIEPDNWLICNYSFDFYFIPFIKKTIPKIKEFHGSQYRRIEERKVNLLQLFLQNIKESIENKYDTLLVLNPDERNFFKSKNTYVIPNAIQIPAKKAKLEKKQLIAAGRIAPVKGFERLIAAWALLAPKYTEWSLHIYGEDYLNTQESLINQVEYLQIQDSVVFKGSTSNMTKTMLEYSIYLMTSHTECFPMVLLESLSVGLPIIAFDVPSGPRNIVSHEKDGLLIENNNITAFANGIETLILEEEVRLKMGERAKLNSERFNINNIMKEWVKLFSTVNKK
ncbi:glycosyltransferase family 4 protein [Croceibacter atlanticus]|uniref:glycosyltransferase family 4 protein n=1 Tax=Croceibacter atlanticus TaxID=313588 RepID=UPI0030DD98E0|tara:strand:- start:87030 stop:88145 length:1116 start_codon:yes stop_codon:yes gene_type:complete